MNRKFIATISILTVAVSFVTIFVLINTPMLIRDPSFDYHLQMLNASATKQGSNLLISFNYFNIGLKDVTIQRFYLLNASTGDGEYCSGNPPEQVISGLTVDFNGTRMGNSKDFAFVLHPYDWVNTTITVPQYSQFLTQTFVGVNVVQKEVVTSFSNILIPKDGNQILFKITLFVPEVSQCSLWGFFCV
jgi:hypothetical protein